MNAKLMLTGFSLTLALQAFCQYEYTQHIRGRIIDKDSHTPLIGATVVLQGMAAIHGTVTDLEGYFDLPGVPVGKCSILVSYLGYHPRVLDNLLVKSAKELILDIELEEKVSEIDEVTVKAYKSKEHALNDMAAVSARSFSVDETERYAGSWGDPSRMATNFAGVFVAGDQRNDIVIRGNSPMGLIWQLEGIPIPSPNHFDMLGATGGPVSMLNNNLLMRSDFFTSAFPAEYGNGTSGVFDLKMRAGNNKNREYTGQVGFNGFELGAEGPFDKGKKASYLVNYRYSMLGLFDHLLWVDGLPYYQDMSFKLNIPFSAGKVSVFGLGGTSHITFIETDSSRTIEGEYPESHTTPGSKTGIIGLNYTHFLGQKTRISSCFSVATRRPFEEEDSVLNDRTIKKLATYRFNEDYFLGSVRMISKLNAKNKLSLGVVMDNTSFDYLIEDYDLDEEGRLVMYDPERFREDNLILLRSFVQWKHRFSDDLTLNSGLHYQYYCVNGSNSLEPRIGLQWSFLQGKTLSLGYGLHSQKHPTYIYFIETELAPEEDGTISTAITNKSLDFTRSHQFVLAYDYLLAPNLRLKSEVYYQDLFDVPVEQRASYFSMINEGAGFGMTMVDSLVNKGSGQNYGLELTVEKFLSNNYFFLVTASVFDSKYTGSDGVQRNTEYNGHYVLNVLGGYEFRVSDHSSLDFSIRVVSAGGRRYIPVDLPASRDEGQTIMDVDNAYVPQVNNYFRTDVRAAYIFHGRRVTHELAVDITNLTNHQNEYSRYYDSRSGTIETEYQQGIFPMGFYRISF